MRWNEFWQSWMSLMVLAAGMRIGALLMTNETWRNEIFGGGRLEFVVRGM